MPRPRSADRILVAELVGAARNPATTAADLVDIAAGRRDLLAAALDMSSGPGEWSAAAPWAAPKLREALGGYSA